MAIRQYMIMFCSLLLVTLGNSFSMKYVIDRINALETKIETSEKRFENENKLRRSETEELFRVFSELAGGKILPRSEHVSPDENITSSGQLTTKSPWADKYKTTELAIELQNLESYIKGASVEKQQNFKLRSELKSISKQLDANNNMFESRIKDEMRNFTNDVSDKLSLLVSEERFNNLSDFVTTSRSELRNEARQSLISLKYDVETYIQKLSNDFLTVNKTAMEKVERCNNAIDSLTIVTNERLNNFSTFVTSTQSDLRNESSQSLNLLKSYVETSIPKLSNDFHTVNKTAMEKIERCKNSIDSLTIVTNERLKNLRTFVTSTQSELRNESSHSLISLKYDVETSIQKLSNGLYTLNKTAMERVEQCNNVTDSLTIVTNGLRRVKNILKPIESCRNAPKSGDYEMYFAKSDTTLPVYCDKKTDGGGWLVIQRRKDGSVDFERTWTDYKNGFGDTVGEFWLGNDNLHALTSSGLNELRIDMEDFDGYQTFAKYRSFKVHPESDLYRLEFSDYMYSGDAKKILTLLHNGDSFCTQDRDNDCNDIASCSEHDGGGWWYSDCDRSNLNGFYYALKSPWYKWKKVNFWAYSWNETEYSRLKTVEMKIR